MQTQGKNQNIFLVGRGRQGPGFFGPPDLDPPELRISLADPGCLKSARGLTVVEQTT